MRRTTVRCHGPAVIRPTFYSKPLRRLSDVWHVSRSPSSRRYRYLTPPCVANQTSVVGLAERCGRPANSRAASATASSPRARRSGSLASSAATRRPASHAARRTPTTHARTQSARRSLARELRTRPLALMGPALGRSRRRTTWNDDALQRTRRHRLRDRADLRTEQHRHGDRPLRHTRECPRQAPGRRSETPRPLLQLSSCPQRRRAFPHGSSAPISSTRPGIDSVTSS